MQIAAGSTKLEEEFGSGERPGTNPFPSLSFPFFPSSSFPSPPLPFSLSVSVSDSLSLCMCLSLSFCFESVSCCVAQDGLKPAVSLSQLFESCDYRCVLPPLVERASLSLPPPPPISFFPTWCLCSLFQTHGSQVQ